MQSGTLDVRWWRSGGPPMLVDWGRGSSVRQGSKTRRSCASTHLLASLFAHVVVASAAAAGFCGTAVLRGRYVRKLLTQLGPYFIAVSTIAITITRKGVTGKGMTTSMSTFISGRRLAARSRAVGGSGGGHALLCCLAGRLLGDISKIIRRSRQQSRPQPAEDIATGLGGRQPSAWQLERPRALGCVRATSGTPSNAR